MKLSKRRNSAVLCCAVVFSSSVLAITPEEDEKQQCKKPKFRDFVPGQLAEALPGGDIAFHVSRNADPLTITADARGEKLKVNVQDKKTFYLVTSKLPALTGGFARIHVTAKAAESKNIESGCLGQDGWLVKIPGEEAPAKPAEQLAPAQ